jgi:hypothetical protein
VFGMFYGASVLFMDKIILVVSTSYLFPFYIHDSRTHKLSSLSSLSGTIKLMMLTM